MNWLARMMAKEGLSSSQLSRLLETKYGVVVSRQVIDNWLRMESERIPVPIGNRKLVCALAAIFDYHDINLFMKDLGFHLEQPEDGISDDMWNIISRLSSFRGEQAEAVTILLGQILNRWEEVQQVVQAGNGS